MQLRDGAERTAVLLCLDHRSITGYKSSNRWRTYRRYNVDLRNLHFFSVFAFKISENTLS